MCVRAFVCVSVCVACMFARARVHARVRVCVSVCTSEAPPIMFVCLRARRHVVLGVRCALACVCSCA